MCNGCNFWLITMGDEAGGHRYKVLVVDVERVSICFQFEKVISLLNLVCW